MQGSYSAYFACCNMQNKLNMSKNMLLYAKQYAKYAFVLERFVHLSGVSRGFNEISTESQALPELRLARSCTELQLNHGSQTWFQRLGWLQRHQRPPFHTCALQSKLSIPFWDLPELAPTSAQPWFRRVWWSKVRLTSPSSPTFHEPASLWRKAGTRRGGQWKLESPGQSVILPWCLYHSFSAWYTIKIKICKIYQICKICLNCRIWQICKICTICTICIICWICIIYTKCRIWQICRIYKICE